MPAVEGFVKSHFRTLPSPTPADRDDGYAHPPTRDPADDVGLVAVTHKQIGCARLKQPAQFPNGREQVRRIAIEGDSVEPSIANAPQKLLAPTAFTEAQKRGTDLPRQVFGEPEHLPFGAAEKRTRREVNQVHRAANPCRGEFEPGSLRREMFVRKGQFARSGEEVGHFAGEAGEDLAAIERGGFFQKNSSVGFSIHGDRALIRGDDLDYAGSGGEIFLALFVELPSRVRFGKHFDA